jgi:hypothetical protein
METANTAVFQDMRLCSAYRAQTGKYGRVLGLEIGGRKHLHLWETAID